MKIEVDTKHDSKEEIKKLIKMLSHLVEDTAVFGQVSAAMSAEETPASAFQEMPGLGFMDSGESVSTTEDKKEDKVSFETY
jgi:uncharacterized protein (UPF0147 family)